MAYHEERQAMLARLSDRLAALLKAEPDWKATADEIVDLVEVPEPDWSSPQAFVASAQGALMTLVPQALKWKVRPEQAESPLDLVQNLLPSDHHLD